MKGLFQKRIGIWHSPKEERLENDMKRSENQVMSVCCLRLLNVLAVVNRCIVIPNVPLVKIQKQDIIITVKTTVLQPDIHVLSD